MDVNSWTSNRFMHNSQQVNVFIHNNNNFRENQLTEESTAHQERQEPKEPQEHIEETRLGKIEELEEEQYYDPLQRQQHQQQQQPQREHKSRQFLKKWMNFTKRLKQIFEKIINYNIFHKGNVPSAPLTKSNIQAFSLKMQETFDEHIDHILHDIIDKHFASSLKEFHARFASNLTNIDLFNLMANCLLENTISRFKRQISNFPTNHVRYIANTARHEVIFNGVNGRYRRLFDGFDISIPPADATTDANNHTLAESNMLRRKIFWDINRITAKSKFVLNLEADKLFKAKCKRHKRQTIQYRHLMRYVADAQDIQWLKEQQQQLVVGFEDNLDKRRILLLLWEQLVDLQKADNCYADYDLSEMHSFTVPEFIIRKIRLSCIRIQIRSNGIITTIPIRKRFTNLPTENAKPSNHKNKRRQQSVNIQSRLKRNINHINKLSAITENNIRNSSHLIFGAFLNNPISASGSYRTAVVYTPRNRRILI